ncbi:MAG TPA: HAD-IIIA family hydrolase [Chthonomonadaceae bacterium]|nr:HAD-IIIA family hydrolase [Chthonomonadaceae bacterium]
MNAKQAVFLDLQGTLGGEGLGDILDFTFYPCALPAVRMLNQNGLLAIVVTNQSHIAKGRFTYNQYEERAAQIQQELIRNGAHLDAIYCCPHRHMDHCACQKPKLGLLMEAQRSFGIALPASYVVGDMGTSDMLMAHAAGCKGILVRTGVGESSLTEYRHTWADIEPDYIASDVLQAVEWIVRDKG